MESKLLCPTGYATMLACQCIARSFKENIFELSRIRKDWDLEYATSLKIWINDTIEKYFDPSKPYMNVEQQNDWRELMVGAIRCLGIIRASVKVDFKDNKTFVKSFMKKHGYDDYFSDAKNGDHTSTHNLLQTFTANLDEKTRKEVVQKGTREFLFDRIFEYAKQIGEFKACFDKLKNSEVVNPYGQKESEEIYGTIKDICRIATAYYQFDPVMHEKFDFYKVLRSL